ncbi:MAG TPA: sigma 54-interacting transcriptional regulator, partial [bacterium]|nr:sigma 54-interacting transcriptional regulator [bacterium]
MEHLTLPSRGAIAAPKLALLLEINQALSRSLSLQECFNATLQILQTSYRLLSGAILLCDAEAKTLHLAAAIGLTAHSARDVYRYSEGVSGRIAETGKPVVVPRVSKEPLFLNRLGSWEGGGRSEQSFLGVPISLDYRTLGVLFINLPYLAKRDYESILTILLLVASTLVQRLHIRQLIEAEQQKLLTENVILKQQLRQENRLQNIIGNSREMREVYEKVAQVAHAATTVLLRGESGTGKELVAQAIHYNSPRSEAPFIRVNCAAIPETLIESEFFGYEKGAFTGAVARKKGRFELADGGTIFLDEVGDLSPMTQVKLLRVLQEHEFERIGGLETLKVDVRIIAATNADLEELMARGVFREDLYYRLNVFAIYLPPLRERKSDILLLADHFMIKYGRQHGKSIQRISTPAIDMLMRYHWPGNVRELENCIERAVLVCRRCWIERDDLAPAVQAGAEKPAPAPTSAGTLESRLEQAERSIIAAALEAHCG